MKADTDSLAMNQVGEQDAGNPHVQFDERSVETGSDSVRDNRLPRHASTLLMPVSGIFIDLAATGVRQRSVAEFQDLGSKATSN
jgi:hypothetical protein